MKWYEWAFDGVGTEIAAAIVGVLLGTIVYKKHLNKKNKQIQISKNKSSQSQIIIEKKGDNKDVFKENKQIQRGKDESEQKQIIK